MSVAVWDQDQFPMCWQCVEEGVQNILRCKCGTRRWERHYVPAPGGEKLSHRLPRQRPEQRARKQRQRQVHDMNLDPHGIWANVDNRKALRSAFPADTDGATSGSG